MWYDSGSRSGGSRVVNDKKNYGRMVQHALVKQEIVVLVGSDADFRSFVR